MQRMVNMPDHLVRYIRNWNLQEDGDPFITSSGWLQPVLFNEIKCMLKIARRDKDRRANEVMIWYLYSLQRCRSSASSSTLAMGSGLGRPLGGLEYERW